MARIARRGLRLQDVPIFSLRSAWSKVGDAQGKCPLLLFEPRYVELARRIEPPAGCSQFGYVEVAERKAGGHGMLLETGPLMWRGSRSKGPVSLTARQKQPFRILSLRHEEVEPPQHHGSAAEAATTPVAPGSSGGAVAPLAVAHVQLLHEKDIQRDIGRGRPTQALQTILGQTYVQSGGLGFASYHFEMDGEAYISYESPLCGSFASLDDGSRPPQKKYFTCAGYDDESRTFRGMISWEPTSWNGASWWEYEMIFSEDFSQIVGGQVRSAPQSLGGSEEIVSTFGTDLQYHRLDSAQTAAEESAPEAYIREILLKTGRKSHEVSKAMYAPASSLRAWRARQRVRKQPQMQSSWRR